jgi:Zn-dependent protease with chaperone function
MRHRHTFDQGLALVSRALRRFSPGSLAMFALALASELPVLLTRVLIAAITVSIVDLLTGHPDHGAQMLWLGALPTLWAILALITPIGSGWWWKQRSGGRRASEREQLAYNDAIETLQSHSQTPLVLPRKWFVIDAPLPDAAVNGHTLMLTRGLLESSHLPAVIAHELGHLATPDGRLTAALNRLVLVKPPQTATELLLAHLAQKSQNHPPRPALLGDETIRTLYQAARIGLWALLFARGGLGLRLTRPVWGIYWRRREYTADAYAAGLGQADELAEFLEAHALIHDHPVPYIWLTEHTHPPTELRIDKLRNNARGDIADRPEPVKGTPPGPPSAGPAGLPLTEP